MDELKPIPPDTENIPATEPADPLRSAVLTPNGDTAPNEPPCCAPAAPSPHKNPVGAAVLSMLFPGLGFFYAGNYYKGFAYLLTLTTLIKFAADSLGRVEFILMSVGFYLFQIFDAFNSTEKLNQFTSEERHAAKNKIDFSFSIVLVCLGLLLLLENLGLLPSFRIIGRLWPVLLIALGVYQIAGYLKAKQNTQSKE